MPLTLLPPFQPAGVKWLLEKERADGIKGGFLCDEMGIGKTAQLVATMCQNFLPKTLVIVPKSIVGQWRSEIKNFTDGILPVRIFDGSDRIEKIGNLDTFEGVVIAPYSVMVNQSSLHHYEWDRIILDEGHEIRNAKTKIHRSLMNLQGDIRWVVSGTPIFNSIKDFISLCAFVGISKGSVVRDYDYIRNKYALRRTRKEAKATISTITLEMTPEEKAHYAHAFESGQGIVSGTDNAIIMLEAILRLRQVMTWPQLYMDGMAIKNNTEPELYTGRSVKHEKLLEMIASHPDEKSLIFTQFTGETDRIQEILPNPVFRIDGNVTEKEERERRIQDFRNAPANAVFLIQIRAGGVGLNLQEASRIYITSPAWNAATEKQAIGRADRTGQTRPVHVTRFVYQGFEGVNSIEESMLLLQNGKSKIAADVLGEGTGTDTFSINTRTIANIFSV